MQIYKNFMKMKKPTNACNIIFGLISFYISATSLRIHDSTAIWFLSQAEVWHSQDEAWLSLGDVW
jgi:hypothetical protein